MDRMRFIGVGNINSTLLSVMFDCLGRMGSRVLTRVKEEQPQVKTIVITGYASADVPVRAIRLKVNDYLFKPFSLQYFLRSVERALLEKEETQSRFALIEKLFAIFSRSKDEALVDLVAERQEAFRGLYLGIKSGHLKLKEAHQIFTSLESSEQEFRALLNTEKVSSSQVLSLQEQYVALLNQIANFESEHLHVSSEQVDQASIAQFSALFESVKSSQIGPDSFQYAPVLRQTPDERFETLPELLELKHRLWKEA